MPIVCVCAVVPAVRFRAHADSIQCPAGFTAAMCEQHVAAAPTQAVLITGQASQVSNHQQLQVNHVKLAVVTILGNQESAVGACCL
jgi:hypothetical protein